MLSLLTEEGHFWVPSRFSMRKQKRVLKQGIGGMELTDSLQGTMAQTENNVSWVGASLIIRQDN